MSIFSREIPEAAGPVDSPVDSDVLTLLDLLARHEMAIEQQGVGLGPAKLNRVLSVTGQLAAKPNGPELFESLPVEVQDLIRLADRRIRPGRAPRIT